LERLLTGADRLNAIGETSQRNVLGARYAALCQSLLILSGLVTIVFPPANGSMLIAPLVPGQSGGALRWAWDAGATPIAAGPYAGSYFVTGSRATLLLPALEHGAVLISGRVAGCRSRTSES
jgi:hypothetical protein